VIAGSDSRRRRLRSSFDVLSGKLAVLDPKAVLTRGYAIALARTTGKAIRSVADVRPGGFLDIQVSDGTFGAVAEEGDT